MKGEEMSPLCMPIIISYKTPLWIRVGLRSFRRFFPCSPILIIDNNLDPGNPGYESRFELERRWIEDWCSQDRHHYFKKTEFPEKNHGLAMDLAAQWCRERGVRWMIHIEPDCLIDGITWANRLLEAATRNVWMAGSHQKSYGPIHPTPSIWDVNQIRSSFREQLRGSDMGHPRFHELVNMKDLMDQTNNDQIYWAKYWDTAQKPWFDAAIHDKALLIKEEPDFKHFWYGSTHNTDPTKVGDPRVIQYLSSFSER
jgi:hypothetical protein